MAAVTAILRALGRAVRRALGTFGGLQLNNFFFFVILIVWGALNSGVMPVAAEPFLLLIGVLLLAPLSADPLARIPPQRLALWPLSSRQRLALRAASLLLSPVLWLAIIALVALSAPLLALCFPLFALAVRAARLPHWNPMRHVPSPPGRLAQLIRNNLRQLLTLLDTWLALLLCAAATAYRLLARAPEPEAFVICAILVALALSTCTQAMFALDGSAGRTRRRLLPVPAWKLLAAKDAAWFLVLAPLVLPLHPGAGFEFALVAVTIGRVPTVTLRLPLERWRFAGGNARFGLAQAIAGTALGMWESRSGVAVLIATLPFYAAGLLWAASYLKRDTVVRQ